MFLLPVRDKSKGSLASKEIPCKGFVKYSTLYRCLHLASIENRNRGRLPKGGINRGLTLTENINVWENILILLS